MSKTTTFLGTACVLAVAALAASPVAAAPLTDMAGTLSTNFGLFDADTAGTNAIKSAFLGGSLAAPIPDLGGLNFQGDLSYQHNWDNGFSQEDWGLGGSVFWGGMDGRLGLNFNHLDFTQIGHVNNGGAFGEWYFGNVTAMAKGGWLSSGGSGFGGKGNYLGAAVTGYVTPDIALTGGIEWGSLIQGQGLQVSGRRTIRTNAFEAGVEWLVVPAVGLSVYGNYTYADSKLYTLHVQAQIFNVGVRWYFGGGSLMDHHRNGTLNAWLPGAGAMKNF